jgi:transposase
MKSATDSDLTSAAAANLHWPLTATLTDRVLEAMLYASAGTPQGLHRRAEQIGHVFIASCAVGVTLMLLWEGYRAREPGGY